MTLLYPSFWPFFCHGSTLPLRFDALVTIGETPMLGMRGARKYMGGGDSQQARKESHVEERGGEGACAAAGKTECGCSGEDHVL